MRRTKKRKKKSVFWLIIVLFSFYGHCIVWARRAHYRWWWWKKPVSAFDFSFKSNSLLFIYYYLFLLKLNGLCVCSIFYTLNLRFTNITNKKKLKTAFCAFEERYRELNRVVFMGKIYIVNLALQTISHTFIIAVVVAGCWFSHIYICI